MQDTALFAGVAIYAPPKQTKSRPDPFTPVPSDSPKVIGWRQRMKSEQAREMYKERASTSQTINAHQRQVTLFKP
jgi:hypothetical protein